MSGVEQGIKPIEFRSRPTRIIGERFYIYASRQWASGKLYLAGCGLPQVRSQNAECGSTELAEVRTAEEDQEQPSALATGNSQLATPLYQWHLADVERVRKLRRPKGHPQPVWFTPF